LEAVAQAVKGNLAARRMMPLSYMELILTSGCNLRCDYCFERDKASIDMSKQTAFAAIDLLIEASRDAKNLTVLFFGGEPMLRFDLMKEVFEYGTQEANRAGKTISWDMTTNGTLIDEKAAKWLARSNVKFLLSMDGAREDHDRHRRFAGGRGTFDLLAGRLPMLRRYQPWMGVKMSVVPESVPNIRHNTEALFRLGINQFIIGYAHGVRWTDSDLAAYHEALLDLCELWLEMKWRKRHFRIATYEDRELRDRLKPAAFGCGAGRGRFCVDPHGDLYGCSKLATIAGPGCGVLPLGNVWQGITNVANRVTCFDGGIERRTKCKPCEFRDVCSGGCPAVNYASSGSVFEPDDVSCKLTFISRLVDVYMRQRQKELLGVEFD
jgi:uncharacterized protein